MGSYGFLSYPGDNASDYLYGHPNSSDILFHRPSYFQVDDELVFTPPARKGDPVIKVGKTYLCKQCHKRFVVTEQGIGYCSLDCIKEYQRLLDEDVLRGR